MDSYNCQLTRFPAEVLGKRAKRIEKIDENIRRIADEMIDIMLANKGVGLAGPQVGPAAPESLPTSSEVVQVQRRLRELGPLTTRCRHGVRKEGSFASTPGCPWPAVQVACGTSRRWMPTPCGPWPTCSIRWRLGRPGSSADHGTVLRHWQADVCGDDSRRGVAQASCL